MTLFLRDDRGRTYVDIDCWVKKGENKAEDDTVELASYIDIPNYSLLLLNANTDAERLLIIQYFDMLSELRDIAWKTVFKQKRNTAHAYRDVVVWVRGLLDNAYKRFGLHVVED